MKEREDVSHQEEKAACSLERNPRMMAWLLSSREMCANESGDPNERQRGSLREMGSTQRVEEEDGTQ